jgi:hypothetical protein
MKKRSIRRFGLPSANNELVVLDGDGELMGLEPRHGEGDAKPVRSGFFNVVRRIAVACAFGGALEQLFQMFEAQKKGASKCTRSQLKALLERLCRLRRVRPPVCSDCAAPKGTAYR